MPPFDFSDNEKSRNKRTKRAARLRGRSRPEPNTNDIDFQFARRNVIVDERLNVFGVFYRLRRGVLNAI